MTAAWFGVALALLLWPRTGRGARLGRLAGSGRLGSSASAPNGGGRTAAAGGSGWRRALQVPPMVVAGVAVGVALITGAAGAGLGSPSAPALALTAATVIALALGQVTAMTHRQDATAHEADLALTLALIRGELHAGSSPAAALNAAGQLGVQIARQASGDGNTAQPGDRSGVVGRVAAAWRMSAETGAPLAEVLGRLRADLAARTATRRAVASAVAGPRSSSLLLALLPVLGVGMGAAIGADPLHVLLASSTGRLLLCAGVLLDAVGLVWTDRLIARAQR